VYIKNQVRECSIMSIDSEAERRYRNTAGALCECCAKEKRGNNASIAYYVCTFCMKHPTCLSCTHRINGILWNMANRTAEDDHSCFYVCKGCYEKGLTYESFVRIMERNLCTGHE
jgi:hypothetical protein